MFLCDNDQALARRAIRFASLSQITICGVFGSCFLRRAVFLREFLLTFQALVVLSNVYGSWVRMAGSMGQQVSDSPRHAECKGEWPKLSHELVSCIVGRAHVCKIWVFCVYCLGNGTSYAHKRLCY